MGITNKKAHEWVMGAKCRLLVTQPWYGAMAMLMEFKEDKTCPTMGVMISTGMGGRIICVYNPDFVMLIDDVEMLTAIIQHEIEHVVRLHCVRRMSDNDPTVWNIAADMTCNGKKTDQRIKHLPEGSVWIPDQWNSNAATEELYAKIMKNSSKVSTSCPVCGSGGLGKGEGEGGGGGDGDGEGEGDGEGGGEGSGEGGGCPACDGSGQSGSGKNYGTVYDDHDQWNKSDANREDAKEIVRSAVVEASSQARGTCPGHLEGEIKKLQKPSYNWRNVLKQFVGRHCGVRRRTHSRPPRRFPEQFGMKGFSHHGSAKLTILVDTSGSVSDKMLEHFFAEVEHISWRYKITLIQFDYGVTDANLKYRRGDWKKIKVKGRGGTDFVSALDYIEEHRLVGQANIILTDGEAPWPEEKKYPVIWAISNNHRGENGIVPPWGVLVKLPEFFD